MEKKTALITGAGKRIGRVMAETLAASGWDLGLHYSRSKPETKELAHNLSSRHGIRTCVVQADLEKEDQVRGLLQNVTGQIGPVNMLINNASIFERDVMGKFSPSLFDAHMAVHVRSPVMLIEQFSALVEVAQISEAMVVNIIDQRVLKPTPDFLSYSLSKAALWQATRILAQSLAPRIRVNAVSPGPVLPSSRQSQADFDRQVSTLPLRRHATPEEVANAVLYFWNMPSVTGQMLALDGGQHLAWETPDFLNVRE